MDPWWTLTEGQRRPEAEASPRPQPPCPATLTRLASSPPATATRTTSQGRCHSPGPRRPAAAPAWRPLRAEPVPPPGAGAGGQLPPEAGAAAAPSIRLRLQLRPSAAIGCRAASRGGRGPMGRPRAVRTRGCGRGVWAGRGRGAGRPGLPGTRAWGRGGRACLGRGRGAGRPGLPGAPRGAAPSRAFLGLEPGGGAGAGVGLRWGFPAARTADVGRGWASNGRCPRLVSPWADPEDGYPAPRGRDLRGLEAEPLRIRPCPRADVRGTPAWGADCGLPSGPERRSDSPRSLGEHLSPLLCLRWTPFVLHRVLRHRWPRCLPSRDEVQSGAVLTSVLRRVPDSRRAWVVAPATETCTFPVAGLL